MRISTKTGDQGMTDVYQNRLQKNDLWVEMFGTIDELIAAIGIARAQINFPKKYNQCCQSIQKNLSALYVRLNQKTSLKRWIKAVEQQIDQLETILPPLHAFIIPGDHLNAAYCHLARTICRRLERRVITLSHQHVINPGALPYLNRLSDLLFLIARALEFVELEK